MNDFPDPDSPRNDQPGEFLLRIVTGARLHFGLLDTVAPFGGAGVMVEEPSTEITICWAPHFAVDDSIAGRALEIATRLRGRLGMPDFPACHIQVLKRSPSHCGLGSGTQISLAIAEGLCRFHGWKVDGVPLAVEIAGRGKRSAIGVHGYFGGGLVVERTDQPSDLNPIQRRVELPSEWRVMILKPTHPTATISGSVEVEQFASLVAASQNAKSRLQDLLHNELLPAAETGDFDRFADAVQIYNRSSGMLFAETQGGPYHGAAVTRLIDQVMSIGGRGVGQSSWGPGVFVWFKSQRNADDFANHLPSDCQIIATTRPKNAARSLRIEG